MTLSQYDRRVLERLRDREMTGPALRLETAGWYSMFYVRMGRMEDRGLVEGFDAPPKFDGLPPLRMYRITAAGREALEAPP